MKSKDIDKLNFRQALADALNGEDTNKVLEVFEQYAQAVRDDIMADYEAYKQTQDATILAQRGVHQLTAEERTFYERLKMALETGDVKLAFTGLDNGYPQTVVNEVTAGIRSEFPLLDAIDFEVTPALVNKVLKNGASAALAKWGALNTAITEELSGAFEMLDITKCKLTAWMPVPKDMLQAGLEWLDAYIRALLVEATGLALCKAAISGTGKNSPIGMDRDVSATAAVVDGEYPQMEAIAIEDLNVDTICALFAALAEDELGRSRIVDGVILIVNPTDYYLRVLPKIAYRNAAGEYVYTLPMPLEIIQDANVEAGSAIIGIGKNYIMCAGYGSKTGAIDFDDSVKFLDDVRVYASKLHANGCPKDSKSFLLLDITGISAVSLVSDEGGSDDSGSDDSGDGTEDAGSGGNG